MLRSYGREADIEEYSDVVYLALRADEPPAFACVVSGESEATFTAFQGILRETEWALGDQPRTLSAWLLQHGERRPGKAPAALEAIGAGRMAEGALRVMPGAEFRQLCDWGQQLLGEESDVIGEWPSATGR